jgi:hypothetical protein
LALRSGNVGLNLLVQGASFLHLNKKVRSSKGFVSRTAEGMIPRSNVCALLDDLKSFFKANPEWE